MSELTRKLVYAIAKSDSSEAQSAFKEAVSEILVDKIETKRLEIAKGMFDKTTPIFEEE